MAPFTITPHHSLSYQCHVPQTAPYQQSKMSLGLSSSTTGTPQDLPLSAYRRMSVSTMLLKIRLHLWQVIQRVQNCFMSVIELFGSNMFSSTCVGKNTAMMGELKKNGVVEAQERPGVEFMSGRMRSVELDEEIMKDSEMELEDEELTTPAERQECSMDDSEEEERMKASSQNGSLKMMMRRRRRRKKMIMKNKLHKRKPNVMWIQNGQMMMMMMMMIKILKHQQRALSFGNPSSRAVTPTTL
ncbi:hypothetical protein E1301_Tti024206 [Triplophysa tibetana]|uniref:Uncharacterized protein n=1 Tax=Triplophysa tibetana TaxID=1572043 RepID=A0A5A9PTP1_9TELE|nr:hypothetical protein E1301_Tti024206 [Triplophysa tibetana]